MSDHGYGPYTHGCRCKICRAAKAEYMRQVRNSRQPQDYVEDITHGYAGYQDYRCRCEVCRGARAEADRLAYQRMKAGEVKPRVGSWTHGRAGYLYRGCRCVHCRAAYAAYRREYTARRRTATPTSDLALGRPPGG